MWGGLEAYIEENPFDHIVPMIGGLTESIQYFLQEPVFIFLEGGSPIGGLMTVTSLSGRVALQNAFLQSHCWSICLSPTPLAVRRLRELYFKTGA